MSVEISHYEVLDGVKPEFLDCDVIEQGVHHTIGYGDGSGYETFVLIRDGRVQLFTGEVVIEDPEARLEVEEEAGRIKVADHIATLQVGQSHLEPLYGPANNNKAFLFVRNIGDPDKQPLAN